MNFYPLFESAYLDGVKDGTTREGVNFQELYLTVTHALMLMSEKFSRGKVFESDTGGEGELDLMIKIALEYIKA